MCWTLFLIKLQAFKPESCNFIKKKLQHICETCEIFKSTYFEEHLRTVASVFYDLSTDHEIDERSNCQS